MKPRLFYLLPVCCRGLHVIGPWRVVLAWRCLTYPHRLAFDTIQWSTPSFFSSLIYLIFSAKSERNTKEKKYSSAIDRPSIPNYTFWVHSFWPIWIWILQSKIGSDCWPAGTKNPKADLFSRGYLETFIEEFRMVKRSASFVRRGDTGGNSCRRVPLRSPNRHFKTQFFQISLQHRRI